MVVKGQKRKRVSLEFLLKLYLRKSSFQAHSRLCLVVQESMIRVVPPLIHMLY